MNLSGVKASFYWARFSPGYLETVRSGNLSDLKNIPRIPLCHSQPRSLLDPTERDCFLGEFVSVIRCLAEGYGKVGFLRRDIDTPIHRHLNNAGDEDMFEAGDENTLSEMSSDDGDVDDGDSGDDPFKID